MPNAEARFWRQVHKTEGCWLYGANKSYGHIRVDGRVIGAHCYSWELHNKASIIPGNFVCHRCDNPRCVNPAHLFLGTQLDNMRDRSVKKRTNAAKGEQHYRASLSDALISEIKKDYASGQLSQYTIAKKYQTTQPYVSRLVREERRS